MWNRKHSYTKKLNVQKASILFLIIKIFIVLLRRYIFFDHQSLGLYTLEF